MKAMTAVVAALAALMLAGCSPSTGSAAADVQSACVAVGGTVGPDQTCRAHSDNDGYTLDFRFPVDSNRQRI
jgi:outer membrane biogenesis lipoprotein LolB